MYFGAELINAREEQGVDADVPIGLIQSAIGGCIVFSVSLPSAVQPRHPSQYEHIFLSPSQSVSQFVTSAV